MFPLFFVNLGCVYVYKDFVGTKVSWILISTITSNSAKEGDKFGFSVINFQGVLTIGSPYHEFNNGIIYLFF